MIASTTCGFQIVFSGAASLVQAIIANSIELKVVGFFFGLALIGGGILTFISNRLMKDFNRSKINKVLMGIIGSLTTMSSISLVINIIISYKSFGSAYMISIADFCSAGWTYLSLLLIQILFWGKFELLNGGFWIFACEVNLSSIYNKNGICAVPARRILPLRVLLQPPEPVLTQPRLPPPALPHPHLLPHPPHICHLQHLRQLLGTVQSPPPHGRTRLLLGSSHHAFIPPYSRHCSLQLCQSHHAQAPFQKHQFGRLQHSCNYHPQCFVRFTCRVNSQLTFASHRGRCLHPCTADLFQHQVLPEAKRSHQKLERGPPPQKSQQFPPLPQRVNKTHTNWVLIQLPPQQTPIRPLETTRLWSRLPHETHSRHFPALCSILSHVLPRPGQICLILVLLAWHHFGHVRTDTLLHYLRFWSILLDKKKNGLLQINRLLVWIPSRHF